MTSRSDLHVLQIGKYYPPHIGGMETHLRTLCGELSKLLKVRALVAHNSRETREDTVDGVEVTRLGTLMRLSGAPLCLDMPRAIKESEADIVHLHLPNPGAAIACLASGFQGPIVLTWHSDIVRQRLLRNAFAPIERRLVKKACAIIASSPDYVAYSPVLYEHRTRCRVIPFGISAEKFHKSDPAAVRRIRERFGGRVLLSIGRMVGYKGYRYLVRAMKKVDAKLLLIGEGPERSRLEADVKRLGIRDRVVFLGSVDDTSPYYHACDIFVLPSIGRNEAFGIVQLEAMASGKPVVNTHLRSGVPFVSVNGLTGITVPPADSHALARAINVLLDDPERRAAYGMEGAERVRREFGLERMIARTFQLYQQVVANNRESSYIPAEPLLAGAGFGA
jgi:glycosyltransferase involved in cell wall biosynthesis